MPIWGISGELWGIMGLDNPDGIPASRLV